MALVNIGCGSDTARAERPHSLADLRLFFDAKARALELRRDEFITTCMAQQGYQYADNWTGIAMDASATPEMYGYVDRLRAALAALAAPTPTVPPPAGNPGAYNLALTGAADGSGTEGCTGEATRRFGTNILDEETIARLNSATVNFEASPGYTAAQGKWVACMAEFDHSYVFTDPDGVEIYLDTRLRRLATDRGFGEIGTDVVNWLRALSPDAAADVLETMHDIEGEVWKSDQPCRTTSGIKEASDELLAIELAEIPDDFFATIEPATTDS
ncbi:MAG: hypothetical protein Q7V57_16775 [Actinomycetota bacterium]|nr:hypothetical protein [Actinomycetota bacterium]